ncbi:hypothetical protein ACHAW5_005905 [Stephanodiscus triporus]|uniref:Uncharacterized protein n=1 Tax=Stephanodiscus triporus TaxID=2934178 RepID=A0ABD3NAA2_9STRA
MFNAERGWDPRSKTMDDESPPPFDVRDDHRVDDGNNDDTDYDDEATDDYSSYWRSIPDPPTVPEDDNDENDNENEGPSTTSTSPATTTTMTTAVGSYSGTVVRRRGRVIRPSFALRDSTNDIRVSVQVDDGSEDVGGDGAVGSSREGGEKKQHRREGRSAHPPFPDDGWEGRGGGGEGAAEGESHPPPSTIATMETTKGAGGRSVEETLMRLVRRYCHLPHHLTDGIDYSTEAAAREIKALSGYTMPGSAKAHLPDLNDRDKRRRFILSMQPIVRVMEERRRSDEEEAVRYTRCVARKEDEHVGKKAGGGKGYRYYDADTGINIPAEEYQCRYVAMIDASRRKRRRSLHHTDGVVGEVGEEERCCDDDAESFADNNIRLAAGGISNDAIIKVLDRHVSEDCPRDDERSETNGIIDRRDNESSNEDIDESTIMDDSSSSSTIPHDDESKAREEYDREPSSIVMTTASSRGARRCSPTPDDDARGSTNGASSYDVDRRASDDAARDEGDSAEPSLPRPTTAMSEYPSRDLPLECPSRTTLASSMPGGSCGVPSMMHWRTILARSRR